MKRTQCWIGILVVLMAWQTPLAGQSELLQIRKMIVTVEEIRREGERELTTPARRATAVAVIENPYAGRYVADLSTLFAIGAALGELLSERAVAALGARPEDVQSYGKAGIAGTAGEIEHLAAVLHPQMGRPMRQAIGGGAAVIPSTVKRGAPGATIDVPLHFKNDEWLFSHIDAVEVRVSDGPAPDEMVIVVAFAVGPRPAARISDTRIP